MKYATAQEAVRECKICYFQRTDCHGQGNPAPTVTVRTYGVFGTTPGLFIFVKVGARSPRPHLFGLVSDNLLGSRDVLMRSILKMVLKFCVLPQALDSRFWAIKKEPPNRVSTP